MKKSYTDSPSHLESFDNKAPRHEVASAKKGSLTNEQLKGRYVNIWIRSHLTSSWSFDESHPKSGSGDDFWPRERGRSLRPERKEVKSQWYYLFSSDVYFPFLRSRMVSWKECVFPFCPYRMSIIVASFHEAYSLPEVVNHICHLVKRFLVLSREQDSTPLVRFVRNWYVSH